MAPLALAVAPLQPPRNEAVAAAAAVCSMMVRRAGLGLLCRMQLCCPLRPEPWAMGSGT